MRDIPRFNIEELDPGLATGNLGDAFQELSFELLSPEFPGLQFFDGKGKDGGIDLIQTGSDSRVVIECKHIGEQLDGLAEAAGRWRKVASNLKSNLASPEGPPKSQPQYGPWYRKDIAIRKYVFCISSILQNPQQFDTLQGEIARFFVTLGR